MTTRLDFTEAALAAMVDRPSEALVSMLNRMHHELRTAPEAVQASIELVIRMGFVPGTRIRHRDMGRFTVLGYNTACDGFYTGERYPLHLRRDCDGYIDMYGTLDFYPPVNQPTARGTPRRGRLRPLPLMAELLR